jgi:hypothetical protein
MYISKLDLAKGYWQVPLDLEIRRKSSIVTPSAQYQCTVTPFGMMNSGAAFVRMMDTVLAGYEEFTDSFIDDSFVKLKTCICSDSVLRSPDFSGKFILQTDASGT